jgi:branched-subunit amino acid ABC-type transport system permease component
MTQTLVNSVVYACEIAVIAIGVSFIYSILRFANFAHVQLAVVGAYGTWTFAAVAGWPIVPATVASLVLIGLLAVAIDRLVFRPLRGGAPETQMIVSWGVALLIRSLVGAVYGGSARVLEVDAATWSAAGARFTSLDVVVVAVTAAAMIVLHLVLHRTRVGTGLRALASNAELAATRGIPGERLIGLVWFIAGAYAALGGTAIALLTDLRPNLDLVILLPVFAAATIGGLGNVFGAVAGALALSLVQNAMIGLDLGGLVGAAPWSLAPQLRDYVAVAAMVLFLLLRPSALARRGAA